MSEAIAPRRDLRRPADPMRRKSFYGLAVSIGLFPMAPLVAEEASDPPRTATSEASQSEDLPPEQPRGEPLWEIGVVGGGGTLPDYPAADQNHLRGLVLPYAIYRGELWRVGDRGLVRGKFVDTRRIEFNLALDASFPVDAEDNDAREGMPDLDYLLEAGPRLIYKFLPPEWDQELDASIAARAVISTDFANWRYQGFVVNPALSYRDERFLDGRLRLSASLGPLFGFDGLNRYFYEVQPEFARPERPEYDADGGYIGSELTVGASWLPFGRIRLFGGVQLGYFAGAVNEDSPLHRDDLNITAGGGVRWAVLQSERRVRR